MSKQISVPENLPTDILWGVAQIAAYIGRDQRSTYYMIAKHQIPAKKLGKRTIFARRSELDAALSKLGAADGE